MSKSALHEFFLHSLGDAYDFEKKLDILLGKVANSVKRGSLADEFLFHQKETRKQIGRIEKIMEILEIRTLEKKSRTIDIMIREIVRLIAGIQDHHVLEIALISTIQKIEHYEAASYDTLYVLAMGLGYEKIADILHLTLEEERNAERYLGELARRGVRIAAAQAA